MSGASMEEFRADKCRLQDSLLDLLAKFETQWGVRVSEVVLVKTYRRNCEFPNIAGITLKVEV